MSNLNPTQLGQYSDLLTQTHELNFFLSLRPILTMTTNHKHRWSVSVVCDDLPSLQGIFSSQTDFVCDDQKKWSQTKSVCDHLQCSQTQTVCVCDHQKATVRTAWASAPISTHHVTTWHAHLILIPLHLHQLDFIDATLSCYPTSHPNPTAYQSS